MRSLKNFFFATVAALLLIALSTQVQAEAYKTSGFTPLLTKASGRSAKPCNVIEGSSLDVLSRPRADSPMVEVRILSGDCKGQSGLLSPERIMAASTTGLRLSRSTPLLAKPMSLEKIACWGFENASVRKVAEDHAAIPSVQIELLGSGEKCIGWVSAESLRQ